MTATPSNSPPAPSAADFERSLALLPAVMPHSAVLTDAQGRIQWVNATFTRISGYTLDEARGRKPGEMLQGRDTDQDVVAQIRHGLRARVGFEGEVYNYDKNGDGYWLALSITPLFDAHQELRGFVSVQTDITQRKQAEQRLRESQEELQQSARSLARRNQELALARDDALDAARLKSEFLTNTSHEVRTPLNGILGMAYLLSESDLEPTQRQWASTLHAAASALLVIINDILDFSKIEAGKLTLEHIPFDLHSLLHDIVTLLAPRAEARGLTLDLCWNDAACTEGRDTTPPDPLRVGDPGRLRQVLLNLVENALKFTPLGGAITLTAQQPTPMTAPDTWRLSVRDTGIGIAPEQQERIFESFTQADGSTTRKYGGTGLGLTICRQLIGLMGGSITLESVPGQGSAFVLDVPLNAIDPMDVSVEAQALAPDGEAETRVALTAAFVLNGCRALSRCALALELEDGGTLEHWAGCLKQDCLSVGAVRMAGLCRQLEALGRGGALAQAALLLPRLEEAWQALRSALPGETEEARLAPPPDEGLPERCSSRTTGHTIPDPITTDTLTRCQTLQKECRP